MHFYISTLSNNDENITKVPLCSYFFYVECSAKIPYPCFHGKIHCKVGIAAKSAPCHLLDYLQFMIKIN